MLNLGNFVRLMQIRSFLVITANFLFSVGLFYAKAAIQAGSEAPCPFCFALLCRFFADCFYEKLEEHNAVSTEI